MSNSQTSSFGNGNEAADGLLGSRPLGVSPLMQDVHPGRLHHLHCQHGEVEQDRLRRLLVEVARQDHQLGELGMHHLQAGCPRYSHP